MKFNKCVWRHDNIRAVTNQRIAAAKIAVKREAEMVAKKREEVGLFPELAEEILPDFTTPEERLDQSKQREIWLTNQFRAERATSWRKARAALYALSPVKRRGFLRFWSTGIYPFDPAYALEAIRALSSPGKRPWTYMRKMCLIRAWREGKVQKPPYFREIICSDLFCLSDSLKQREKYKVLKTRKAIAKGVQLYL